MNSRIPLLNFRVSRSGWFAGKIAPAAIGLIFIAASIAATPVPVLAQASNPVCPSETVFFDPGMGQDIAVPEGYKVEVFAKGLNFPTDVAFQGDRDHFKVIVLESGTGLPSRCNDATKVPGIGQFDAANPFTPDILIFDRNGHKIAGPLGKPTAMGGGFQPDGPAIGLAFEFPGGHGRLFATDSNQGVRGAPGTGNNTSRIVTVDLRSGMVMPFIAGLPTGDHPTEEIQVKGNFIYWSQGSATNAGVTGHDNGAGGNQHDIACQDITLSNNVFDSGDGHMTSGYSNHGTQRPGAMVPAFESATKPGMCTGAILRARIDVSNPANTVQPVSWGYRNPFGLRFSPKDHPLEGKLFVSENGEDERGARPTNNAPDRLQVAQMNPDGSPDYHGWPDRFGFLDSTQAIFNPLGGPGDDLQPASKVLAEDVPVRHVLAFPPQAPVAPVGLEPTDVAVVGLDFAPRRFTGGVVHRGAALIAREGDLGFSPANGTPIEGHDIQLANFKRKAFVHQLHGINRPVAVRFGPDGALYLVDFGAVRDFGQSEPDSRFADPADAPLVQIPGTGVIWKITRTGPMDREDDDHNGPRDK